MLSVKKNLEKSIKKTEINQLPENLRTELITLGNLFDELQKIKEGKSKHHCTVRNMLHILMGQFENKGIDTSSEVQEIAVKAKSKAKTAKAKTTKSKTKEKTPCKHCEKLFVYPDKHEKNCKKNTEVVASQTSESIAIKA